MKCKKVLATILAVMMIVSMLPMNALAAYTPTEGTKNVINYALSVDTSFGGEGIKPIPGKTADTIEISSPADYNTAANTVFGRTSKKNYVYTIADASPYSEAKHNVDMADGVFDSTKQSVENVGKSSTIYVGLKISLDKTNLGPVGNGNNNTATGLVGASFALEYDPAVLVPPRAESDIALNYGWQGKFGTAGYIGTNAAGEELSTDADINAATYPFFCDANALTGTALGVRGGGKVDGTTDNTDKAYVYSTYNYVGTTYCMMEANAWDIVIPFTVKQDATITDGQQTTLRIVQRAEQDGSSTTLLTTADVTSGVIGTDDVETSAKSYTFEKFSDRFKSNDVTITFSSNSMGMSTTTKNMKVAAGGTTVVPVTLSKATFKPAAAIAEADTNKWSADNGATITKVELGSDNTTADVTLNTTGVAAGTTITITAKNDILTEDSSGGALDNTGEDLTATVTTAKVPEADTGTSKNVQVGNDGAVVMADSGGAVTVKADSDAAVKTKLYGDANWSTEVAQGNSTEITAAQLLAAANKYDTAVAENKADALTPDTNGIITYPDLLQVAYSGSETMPLGVDVKRYAPVEPTAQLTGSAPATVAAKKAIIDYKSEKIYVNADTQVSVDGTNFSAGNGTTGTSITDAIDDGTAIKTKVEADFTSDVLGSAEKSVTIARVDGYPNDKKPDSTTGGNAKQGKTKISNVAEDDEYLIQTTLGATPPSTENWIDGTTFVNGTNGVERGTVSADQISNGFDLTTLQTIWFRKPATDGTSAASTLSVGRATATPKAASVISDGVTGTGNAYGTVTVTTKPTKTTKELVLTIEGDEWNDNIDTAGLTLTKGDSTPVAGSWAKTNATTATFTATNNFEVNTTGEKYKVAFTTAASKSGNTPKDSAEHEYIQFTVSNKGYDVSADVTAVTGVTCTSGTGTNAEKTDVPVKFTLPAWKTLDTKTTGNTNVTVTGGTLKSIEATADTDANTEWTVTVTTPNDKVAETVTTNPKVVVKINSLSDKKHEVTDAELTGMSDASKEFNGKKDNDDVITFTAIKPWGDGEGAPEANVTIAAGDATYTESAVDTKTLTVTKYTIDNKANFDISGLTTPAEITVTTGITKKKNATAVAADAGTVKNVDASTTIDTVLNAIKGAQIEVDGLTTAETDTVAAQLNADTDLIAQIKEWADGEVYTSAADQKAETATVDATKAGNVKVTHVKDSTITLTLPEGGATTAINNTGTTATGITRTNDTTYAIAADATDGDVIFTVTPTDTNVQPYDVKVTLTLTEAAEKYDFSKAIGEQTITVVADKADGFVLKNLQAAVGATDVNLFKTITIKVKLQKKTNSPTGGGPASSSGYTATFDGKGYGTVDSTYVETDADGKLISLPKVTSVVKGAQFLGWSVNGKASGIIDPDTYRVTDDSTVLYAVYTGYMAGYEDHTAKPDKTITRAELAKLLVTASGIYDRSKTYASRFDDVTSGWYVNYVNCAAEAGIVNGVDDKHFEPNAGVTRQDAAIMIAKTFNVTVTDGDVVENFLDKDEISGYAQKYVKALTYNGTISGYAVDGGYEFRPVKNVTRAEAARMINAYLISREDLETLKADADVKNTFTDMTNKNAWHYADIMFASLSAPADYYGDTFTDLANN